jgi:O-antigen/teichoic acid export membrane protein
MSEKRVVANNVMYLTLAELLGRILQFFYYKHITVALGAEAFGVFSWSVTNIMYFFIIVGAGLDFYGIREVTKDKSKTKYYSDIILSLRLFLSIIAFFVLCNYAFLLPKSLEVKIVVIIAGLRLFADALLPNWIYQAIEKMHIMAIRNFFLNFLNFILAYFLISSADDLFMAISVVSFNLILTSFVSLYHYHSRIDKINLKIDFKKYITILKQSLPIGFSVQILIFYNFADIIMLGYLRENFEYEVGIYSAAARIIMLSMLPNQILQQAFFPKFSLDDPNKPNSYINNFTKFVYFIGAFLTIFIILYSREIILLQFSIEYKEAIMLLQFMGLKVFLAHLAISFSSPMLAKNRERIIMYAVGAAFILNVILNYIFIPIYGFYGAAYTTIICEFVIVIIFIHSNYKKYGIVYFSPLLNSLLLIVIIYVIHLLTNSILNFNIYFSAIISIFTFFILTIVFKIISLDELKAIIKR